MVNLPAKNRSEILASLGQGPNDGVELSIADLQGDLFEGVHDGMGSAGRDGTLG